MEIRLHGRGGQGGVTCAKLLAACYARQGKHVQTFGDYAGERSGAPVRAYTRVEDAPVTNRNKVYRPDHVVVLDRNLLGADTLDGLAPGGILLVNTNEPFEAFDARFDRFALAVVDATGIARRHGIGTKTVVIVNTTIAGAFARLADIPLEVLETTYRSLGFLSNFEAAREAWQDVRTRAPRAAVAAEDGPAARPSAPAPVEALTEHVASAPTGLRTGNWSSQRPRYREHPAPCNAWCPAGNDVVGFVQALARAGIEEAGEVLRATTPLAATCGRVCPAPCMEGCNRAEYDGAVHIRGIERWIADRTAPGWHAPLPPADAAYAGNGFAAEHAGGASRADGRPEGNGRDGPRAGKAPRARRTAGAPRTARSKDPRAARALSAAAPGDRRRLDVAVVGGGPAGIAAAWTLARAGHRATIHDRERVLGGLLATGIPSYRLPREVLRRELGFLAELGVETRLGRALSADDLRRLAREHDAVVLATGLQRARGLGVPGARLAGVEDGLAFLRRLNLEGGVRVSGHVVVLGGGNSAIDCARSALRVGAARVTVAYRRTRGEMPAIREELVQAESEGVELRELAAPVGFVGGARVLAVELAEVELGEPDETGRRSPVVTDRVRPLACDQVLLALGSAADLRILPDGWALRDGRVFEAGEPLSVFVAGDLASGDGTVAHAIGSGRRAATEAMRALGDEVAAFQRPVRAAAVSSTDIRFDHFERREPARERHAPGAVGELGFAEVDLGLPDALEAHRCFSCGHCTYCDTCLVYCPEGIVSRSGARYELDYAYCKGCGICVHECPRKGMEMTAS